MFIYGLCIVTVLYAGAASDASEILPGTVRQFCDIEMVYVPSGKFVMGSPPTEEFRDPRGEIQREIAVPDAFWIGKCEVTQAQWKSVMGYLPRCSRLGDDLPVDRVTWNECHQFIETLNKRGKGQFRLPSEEEWEYACRAGSTSTYCFGDNESKLRLGAWIYLNHDIGPRPVGLLKPNDWGLYDTHGNVNEWCETTYSCAAAGSEKSPGTKRAIYRGGSWLELPRYHRSASRGAYNLGVPKSGVGLRLCRDIDPAVKMVAQVMTTLPPEKKPATHRSSPSTMPMHPKPEDSRVNLHKSTESNAADNRRLTDDLCAAAFRCDIDECRRLLDRGAPINATDETGRTALHYAAMTRATEVAELLITRGASARIHDNIGLTPVDWAEALGHRSLAAQLRK